HAARLRDTVRAHLAGSPLEFATAWDQVTEEEFTPWYLATIATDRARLAEMEASRRGVEPAPPGDQAAAIRARLPLAAARGATVFRALAEVGAGISLPTAALSKPGVLEAIERCTQPDEKPPLAGPDRAALLALVA